MGNKKKIEEEKVTKKAHGKNGFQSWFALIVTVTVLLLGISWSCVNTENWKGEKEKEEGLREKLVNDSIGQFGNFKENPSGLFVRDAKAFMQTVEHDSIMDAGEMLVSLNRGDQSAFEGSPKACLGKSEWDAARWFVFGCNITNANFGRDANISTHQLLRRILDESDMNFKRFHQLEFDMERDIEYVIQRSVDNAVAPYRDGEGFRFKSRGEVIQVYHNAQQEAEKAIEQIGVQGLYKIMDSTEDAEKMLVSLNRGDQSAFSGDKKDGFSCYEWHAARWFVFDCDITNANFDFSLNLYIDEHEIIEKYDMDSRQVQQLEDEIMCDLQKEVNDMIKPYKTGKGFRFKNWDEVRRLYVEAHAKAENMTEERTDYYLKKHHFY